MSVFDVFSTGTWGLALGASVHAGEEALQSIPQCRSCTDVGGRGSLIRQQPTEQRETIGRVVLGPARAVQWLRIHIERSMLR